MSSVLVVNAGSSSLKYQLVDLGDGKALASGLIERIGQGESEAAHRPAGREAIEQRLPIADHAVALAWALQMFAEHGPDLAACELIGIGHRVVQGGARYDAPALVTPKVIKDIEELVPLAPLHNAANLLGIQAALETFGDLPNVVVFDTAFHATMPVEAYRYALDAEVAKRYRIRRYGAHGTSHQYVSGRMAELLGRPLDQVNSIVLHLGNGASACAVRGGRSVDTSMGMTPLAGLVMGSRTGDIDPAVVFHLARQADMSIDEIDTLFNKHSGLLGLAGSNDMRDVRARAEAGDEAAREALAVYTYRIRGTVGNYLAQLGHTDAIAFTAGVGENSPETRLESMSGLKNLGVRIDPERNASGPRERRISADDSAIEVWVVPTNEELEIARLTAETIKG